MLPALRLHHFLPLSLANGPGRRAVLWLQGCTLNCLGCFNPHMHARQGGTLWTVNDLFEKIVEQRERIEGITLSGGEPLQQPRPLLALLERLRAETSLSILLFSGYEWDAIRHFPFAPRLLAALDVLICGRYRSEQHRATHLLGSTNQQILFLTRRYSGADLEQIPEAELILTTRGEWLVTGIDPFHS